MKKLLALLLAAVMVLGLTACGSKKSTDKGVNSSSATESSASTVSEPDAEEPEKEWGVTENMTVKDNDKTVRVFVNFRDYLGPTRGTGKLAAQGDGSVMIIDGHGIVTEIELPDDKAENIFPAYFEQTKKIMNDQYAGHRENYEFTLESKENVTINGYEMCKVTGTHTYNEIGRPKILSQKFVAYATFAKQNGAVVYWMVLDGTEDGSLSDKLEDSGRKMAESFREDYEE